MEGYAASRLTHPTESSFRAPQICAPVRAPSCRPSPRGRGEGVVKCIPQGRPTVRGIYDGEGGRELRYHHRRRRFGRLRAGGPAERERRRRGSCSSKPDAIRRLARSRGTFATPIILRISGRIISGPLCRFIRARRAQARRRAITSRRASWAADPPSTRWSRCAACPETTTNGRKAARAAGRGRDVLPYFRKLENDHDVDGPLHGKDGPVACRPRAPRGLAGFRRAVAAAAGARGFNYVDDMNGEVQNGFCSVPTTSTPTHRRLGRDGLSDAGGPAAAEFANSAGCLRRSRAVRRPAGDRRAAFVRPAAPSSFAARRSLSPPARCIRRPSCSARASVPENFCRSLASASSPTAAASVKICRIIPAFRLAVICGPKRASRVR